MGRWLEQVKLLDREPVDVDYVIKCACQDLPVSVDWVRKEVLDEFDIQQITNRQLGTDCLAAHIKYQMMRHKIIRIRDR